MISISIAFLFTATKYVAVTEKKIDIKIEKKQQAFVAKENTTEILHGELLFRF